jgi:hypothetical protein
MGGFGWDSAKSWRAKSATMAGELEIIIILFAIYFQISLSSQKNPGNRWQMMAIIIMNSHYIIHGLHDLFPDYKTLGG